MSRTTPRSRIECELMIDQLKMELLDLQAEINNPGTGRRDIKGRISIKTQQLISLKRKITVYHRIIKELHLNPLDDTGMSLLIHCHEILSTWEDAPNEIQVLVNRVNQYLKETGTWQH